MCSKCVNSNFVLTIQCFMSLKLFLFRFGTTVKTQQICSLPPHIICFASQKHASYCTSIIIFFIHTYPICGLPDYIRQVNDNFYRAEGCIMLWLDAYTHQPHCTHCFKSQAVSLH